MNNKEKTVVGTLIGLPTGALVGVLAGLVLGVVLGGAIGSNEFHDPKLTQPSQPGEFDLWGLLGVADACLSFLGMIVGAAVGALIGIIAGGALGAGVGAAVGAGAGRALGKAADRADPAEAEGTPLPGPEPAEGRPPGEG
jgi:hypothetical protein